MIIRKMQASFGKLQNRTLELESGLNIIAAPNEGGKSTWSAFLRAMFYGVSTKERDKQGYLAEKNRYQPWSGAAMEGTLTLEWQGREITLRRSTKGAAVFSVFEAVYTATGEAVPGLTGENCGETLLGVPREVFERSAFVGQGGTTIDGAPALEARIAALCSSGEEEVSYSQVERRLKDWRNARQHNKTGMIPKLEGELAVLDDTLARQAKAHRLAEEAQRELARLGEEKELLQREQSIYNAKARQERGEKYAAARAALERAKDEVAGLEREQNRHGAPPERAALRQAQEDLNYLNTVSANLKLAESQAVEAQKSAQMAQANAVDPMFPGMTPDEAWHRADEDTKIAARKNSNGVGYLCAGLFLLGAVAAVLVALFSLWSGRAIAFVPAGVFAAAGIVLLVRVLRQKSKAAQARIAVLGRYEAAETEELLIRANAYREACVVAAEAEKKVEAVTAALAQLTAQRDELRAGLLALTHAFAPEVTDVFGVSAAISRALGLEERLATARVRLEGAQRLVDSLPPAEPVDSVAADGAQPRYDAAETAGRISAVNGEVSRLQNALATAQGELNTRGDPTVFLTRREELLEELERRRGEHGALILAMEELENAHGLLQERFSPALNQRAGELMDTLTGGKYSKVTLNRQFEAVAEETDGLMPRRAISLSQGTVDQLYLAVRLAVCELALPAEDAAPLVLDDALGSFDDGRMALVLRCLDTYAKDRQIILFTCHSREAAWAAETGLGHIVPLQS